MKQRTETGFSIVELIIVVAVLGIMAAIVVPQFQRYSVDAKESVAKEGLRMLRSGIEVYTAQNGGIPPGYVDNDPLGLLDPGVFVTQLTQGKRYMSEMPENPFNGLDSIKIIGNSESFPSGPSGQFGWVYQPATKTIRLDWSGTDKDGQDYFTY
jgi:prepilin-type N-terminal cleavage/methylation domain-containing protein